MTSHHKVRMAKYDLLEENQCSCGQIVVDKQGIHILQSLQALISRVDGTKHLSIQAGSAVREGLRENGAELSRGCNFLAYSKRLVNLFSLTRPLASRCGELHPQFFLNFPWALREK